MRYYVGCSDESKMRDLGLSFNVAGATGFEPAVSALTGPHVNRYTTPPNRPIYTIATGDRQEKHRSRTADTTTIRKSTGRYFFPRRTPLPGETTMQFLHLHFLANRWHG